MSAGFKIDGKVYWGSNGAIETYLERMSDIAASEFGWNDPLTVVLRREREGLFGGTVVAVDAWVHEPATWLRVGFLFHEATQQILLGTAFTDHGREWVRTTMTEVRERIAELGAGSYSGGGRRLV